MSFIIEKGKPNAALWEKVQTLSKGSVNYKAQAADLILQNYSVLPQDADDLLKKFTLPDAPVTLRRKIAISLSKKPKIPWSLHTKLISNLLKGKDDRINSTLKSDFEKYSKMQESVQKSIQSLFQQQQSVLNSFFKFNIPDSLSKQYSSISRFGEYFSNNYFSNILKDINRTANSFNSIQASIPKLSSSLQFTQAYLDTLANLRAVNTNFLGSLSKIAPSYYPTEKPIETKKTENSLIVKLKEVPPGNEHWHEYQTACKDILNYCLVPPLLEPFEEVLTEEGLHRRDIIYHIPFGEIKFWSHIQSAYKSIAVIVDSKNYSDELPPNQVVITSKYFGIKKLGNFGLIISPKGPSKACRKQQIDRWMNHNEIILCLSNDDLSLMVSHKEDGKNPEVILDNLIRELRQSV